MDKMVKINDQITVNSQPTTPEFAELQELGFKTIVNVRTDDEDKQPLSPQAEGGQIESLGLAYLHFPVSMKAITPLTVDQFRQSLSDLPKPIFVHCKAGRRAALMAIMHIASEAGMLGAEATKAIELMGFRPDKAETENFVKQYVDSHAHVSG